MNIYFDFFMKVSIYLFSQPILKILTIAILKILNINQRTSILNMNNPGFASNIFKCIRQNTENV
jgi:hypothetical protein